MSRPEVIVVKREVTVTASGKQDWTDFRRTITPQIEQIALQLHAAMQKQYFGRDS